MNATLERRKVKIAREKLTESMDTLTNVIDKIERLRVQRYVIEAPHNSTEIELVDSIAGLVVYTYDMDDVINILVKLSYELTKDRTFYITLRTDTMTIALASLYNVSPKEYKCQDIYYEMFICLLADLLESDVVTDRLHFSMEDWSNAKLRESIKSAVDYLEEIQREHDRHIKTN